MRVHSLALAWLSPDEGLFNLYKGNLTDKDVIYCKYNHINGDGCDLAEVYTKVYFF